MNRVSIQDESALSLLYDKYSAALYGITLRICKDEMLAQEALQETFLKIWKNPQSYDASKGKFFTWANRIARNTSLNCIRSKKMFIQNTDLSVYEDKEVEEEPQDFLKLNGCLKNLDPHHQKAIELVYFNGLTHKEAHEEMGVPLGTFKSYIKQAVKKLRENYAVSILLSLFFIT